MKPKQVIIDMNEWKNFEAFLSRIERLMEERFEILNSSIITNEDRKKFLEKIDTKIISEISEYVFQNEEDDEFYYEEE